MENTERSYPFKAHHGEIQFIAEKDINEEHAKYFMRKLIDTFNGSSNDAKALFENMLCHSVGVPSPALPPHFPAPGSQELVPVDTELKEIVEKFNGSPLVVRDFFTRATLENIGIHLEIKDPVTLPAEQEASKIILLNQ